MTPSPVITGCAGHSLTDAERSLIKTYAPWGLILFARNIDTPDQVRALVADFKDLVGRQHAPILIDQEGGVVARLRPPHWDHPPSPTVFAEMAQTDPERAARGLTLSYRLIADDLANLGISADCAPMVDVAAAGADPIMRDRRIGENTSTIIRHGQTIIAALADGGIAPVVKHVPGHGRATVDSHKTLPKVGTARSDLTAIDFAPFKALNQALMMMTAHVVYTAIDPAQPASLSRAVIDEIIRGEIGFDGLLMSDDIDMKALTGTVAERTTGPLAAGCDVVLQCNGVLADMEAALTAAPRLSDRALERAEAVEAWIAAQTPQPIDRAALKSELHEILG